MKKAIAIQDLQTAQEYWFAGSTPEVEPSKEADWYIPQGVLKGAITIDEAIEARRKAGHFNFGMFNPLLQIADRRPVSIGFSAIDERTGETTQDPKIIGLWDENKGIIIKVNGRDLTQEAYEIHKKLGVDLRLREDKAAKERGASSSEQKG